MSGSLQAGSAISHYRVISPLGSGGMGEVYMARDEALERAVALKILPPELTRNEDRVRRFVQEARSASSLSHPHIVTIYEIGRAEPRSGEGAGEDKSAPLHFIAMELITGETLKHKIHREKTDLRTLLRYLAQAAEGLAKAHSAGIIHRDLKPENIMINRDGYAKILDFGLAKLAEEQEAADGASAALTSSPTREQTREGAILGTVGYMSPEQVLGKGADHRSDIFSFGCILYEAATRQKPFAADSPVETMHRILHDRPAPVEQHNPEAPAVLRRVIRRCLAKSPDQRYQSMKDLALELDEIAEEYDDLSVSSDGARSLSGLSGAVLAQGRGRGPLLRVGAVLIAALGLAGLVTGIIGLRRTRTAPAAADSSFQNMRMEPLTTTGNVEFAALSPDGKYLANARKEAGGYSLWVRQVATGSDVQIVPPLPTPFRGVTFSPDENYVYYVNQETSGPGYSVLYQVPVLGGAARKLLFDVDTAVTFSPDGTKLALERGYPAQGEGALVVANADGSGERKLLVLKHPLRFAYVGPSWSPDGKRILTALLDLEQGALMELAVVDAESGRLERLGGARWLNFSALAWLPDGSGLVVTAAENKAGPFPQLWLVSYPGGETRRITNDLNQYAGISITADSKTLATTRQNRIVNAYVASPGDGAGIRQITFGAGKEDAIDEMEAGPGDRIYFTALQSNAAYVGSMNADGSRRARLTTAPGRHFRPAASRDGKVVAFTSLREDRLPHVWKMDPDGGNPAQITRGAGETLLDLSPDGRWILYQSIADTALYRISIDGGEPLKVVDTLTGGAQFSPDGKWIACESYVQGKERLERALLVLGPEGRKPVRSFPFPEGAGVRWAPDGKALTYYREAGGVANLWSQPLEGGAPKQITDFKSDQIFSYDWSADGKQIYLARGSETKDVVLIRDFR